MEDKMVSFINHNTNRRDRKIYCCLNIIYTYNRKYYVLYSKIQKEGLSKVEIYIFVVAISVGVE